MLLQLLIITITIQPSAIELFRSLLPDCGTLNVTSAPSLTVFRKRLKTFSQWLCHFGHYNRSFTYSLTYYHCCYCV